MWPRADLDFKEAETSKELLSKTGLSGLQAAVGCKGPYLGQNRRERRESGVFQGVPGPVEAVCARLGARAARVRRPDRATRATDCEIPAAGPVVAGFCAGRGSGLCRSRSAVSRCETDALLGPAVRIWPAPPAPPGCPGPRCGAPRAAGRRAIARPGPGVPAAWGGPDSRHPPTPGVRTRAAAPVPGSDRARGRAW